MIPYNQLSLTDIFSDCQDIYESDKPQFLSLLQQHIDLAEIVPASFRKRYYSSTGRSRKYPLFAMLWALIIQRIFSIPTDPLLLVFLHYSRHLREFCGFDKVPDPSKITRFKQDFLEELQLLFDRLVDLTEPICQAIDPEKADMSIFDSSGIEAWVTENNPKYANRIIKQLKAYAKSMGFDDSYDPYKAAYASMPSHACANPDIKQLYIDGHFCYAYKFGIVTNGLGIVRSVVFYNKDFFQKHPEIIIEKKSDSPDEDKSVHDARLLIPTLKDFFLAHPLINPKTFLGDAAFDSAGLYKALLSGDTFGIDEEGNGIPCCPSDGSLEMIYEGTSKLRSGVTRYKFVCPKIRWEKDASTGKYHRVYHCENPCTDSPCGRMVYLYPEKICGHIPVHCVEQRNGITPIRFVPPWSAQSIISKTVLVFPKEKLKTKKLFTQI